MKDLKLNSIGFRISDKDLENLKYLKKALNSKTDTETILEALRLVVELKKYGDRSLRLAELNIEVLRLLNEDFARSNMFFKWFIENWEKIESVLAKKEA